MAGLLFIGLNALCKRRCLKKKKKKTQMQELDANAGNPITHLVPQNSNFEINLRKFQVIINFFLKFNVLSSFNTLIFFFFLFVYLHGKLLYTFRVP